jgi:hypothetical protein
MALTENKTLKYKTLSQVKILEKEPQTDSITVP